MNDYRDIITIEPGKRRGQPCIRGMRITVYDVFEYLASGMTVAEVLHDFPELTETDIRACFAYAADKEKSQMVVYTDEAAIGSEPIRLRKHFDDIQEFTRDTNAGLFILR